MRLMSKDCNTMLCHRSVILSEAHFSGVEGSALRAKPESLYPDELHRGSPLAGARVDLNASFRDTPTLVSL
jgi:hypothetical protein